MTVRNWTGDGWYLPIQTPWAWSPPGAPQPGDDLVIRHGAASALFSDTSAETIWLGGHGETASLLLAGATARVNMGVAPTDVGNDIPAARLSFIDVAYRSTLFLDSGSQRVGSTQATIQVDDRLISHFTLHGNTAFHMQGGGVLLNADTALSNTDDTIDLRVAGAGHFDLYGFSHLSFLHSVGAGQTINVYDGFASTLAVDAPSFAGSIHAEAPIEIDLNGIAGAAFATDGNGVVTLFNAGGVKLSATRLQWDTTGGYQVVSEAGGGAKIELNLTPLASGEHLMLTHVVGAALAIFLALSAPAFAKGGGGGHGAGGGHAASPGHSSPGHGAAETGSAHGASSEGRGGGGDGKGAERDSPLPTPPRSPAGFYAPHAGSSCDQKKEDCPR